MEGPLTRTADVPARELVSQIPREAASAGVDPQPETLRSRAALLYEAMDDSLIPRLQVKEPHSRRIALDTAITLCPEYAVARYREPDFLVHARHFRTCLAYALSLRGTRARLRRTVVYGFGMVPADLGTAPTYDQSRQNIGQLGGCLRTRFAAYWH